MFEHIKHQVLIFEKLDFHLILQVSHWKCVFINIHSTCFSWRWCNNKEIFDVLINSLSLLFLLSNEASNKFFNEITSNLDFVEVAIHGQPNWFFFLIFVFIIIHEEDRFFKFIYFSFKLLIWDIFDIWRDDITYQ